MVGEFFWGGIESAQVDECCPMRNTEKDFFRSVQRLNRGRLMAADDMTHGDLEDVMALKGERGLWAGKIAWNHVLRTKTVRPSVWRAKSAEAT